MSRNVSDYNLVQREPTVTERVSTSAFKFCYKQNYEENQKLQDDRRQVNLKCRVDQKLRQLFKVTRKHQGRTDWPDHEQQQQDNAAETPQMKWLTLDQRSISLVIVQICQISCL